MVTDFAEILALNRTRPDCFTTTTPGEAPHLFGGLTFGVAARAAANTVESDRHLYAATCQYVGAARGGLELEIWVERVRDGRKLSLRRVTVGADHGLVFTCDAWFAPEGEGADWQPSVPVSDLAEATELEVLPWRRMGFDPFEVKSIRSPEEAAALRVHPYWARSRHEIGDDRALELGALAFLSDMFAVGLVRVPSADMTSPEHTLTLNHTLWVHRPFTTTRWLQVDGRPLSIHGDRGVASGSIHDEDGALVASFVQESTRRP